MKKFGFLKVFRFFVLMMAALMALQAVVPGVPVEAKSNKVKLVALTFDDGPGPYTSALIDSLNKKGVKVTFFMLGQNASYYPSVVKKAVQSGHQIGNHSWDHPMLTSLSYNSLASQINKTNSQLKKADGNSKHWLRPPYGDYNNTVCSAAGAPLVYWSVDTLDWKTLNANATYSAIMKDAYDGAIILVHDIHKTSVDGALRAIDGLKAKGYEFVTVEQLIKLRYGKAKNGKMYFDAKPNSASLDLSGDVYTTTTKTKIRSSASSSSKTVATISSATKVFVSKKSNDGWFKAVSITGDSGYIYYKDIKPYDSGFKSFTAIVPGTANVRKAPSNSSEITKTLACGTSVKIDGKLGNWYYAVLDDGSVGYIYNNNVRKSSQLNIVLAKDAKLKGSASTSSATLKSMKTGQKLQIIENCGNGWLRVKFSSKTAGYVDATCVSLSVNAKTLKAVSVRKSSDNSSAVVASAKSGVSLKLIGFGTNGYLSVKLSDGTKGYVPGNCISI